MNPDKPFVLRGGLTEQAAVHNRIAAIERISYLSGIDLRSKSLEYLKALDLELWERFYKHEPKDKKIDEEFCFRAASVIKEMEKDLAGAAMGKIKVREDFFSVFKEATSNLDQIPQNPQKKEKKQWLELATLKIRACWKMVSTRLGLRKQS